MNKPDHIFEVSWEVCNKIGGIHTVVSTKALTLVQAMGDNYISIGPDVWRESSEHPEFEEDPALFPDWKDHAFQEGIRVRIGRWKIAGRPIAILIDFTPYFNQKDDIFKSLWESYKLDSISGQWDYVEPALFGYSAGKVIENFARFYEFENQKLIAHFHEWQTGAGLLYLEQQLPTVGTVFTTHATTVGRSIAGNGQALYGDMDHINGDQKARELNVVAKHSLEKKAGNQADAFTTVSELTAKECLQFHEKKVDVVLPNGFEDSFVPLDSEFGNKRGEARKRMIEVASALCGEAISENAMLLASSGRYEFRNKGLDLFIDALGDLNRSKNCSGQAVAFILIPANHYGPRKDLQELLMGKAEESLKEKHLTHNLHYSEYDQILNRITDNGLNNGKDSPVKVIFVPSYLNGSDGVFNLAYYDLLIGLDLTIFPSYYEPWGYTPLESLAFSVPTVTTTLTGFGLWVNDEYKKEVPGIVVIPRDDFNDQEVVSGISDAILQQCKLRDESEEQYREGAYAISRIALWNNLISEYWKAYDIALESASGKELVYYAKDRIERLPETEQALVDIHPFWRKVNVHQSIPDKLKPLEEISRNLWWSWTQDAIDLFASIDLFEVRTTKNGAQPVIEVRRKERGPVTA